MINEKERNKEMCKCGHRRGQHSYVESHRCLRVMICKCKGFEKAKIAVLTGNLKEKKQ